MTDTSKTMLSRRRALGRISLLALGAYSVPAVTSLGTAAAGTAASGGRSGGRGGSRAGRRGGHDRHHHHSRAGSGPSGGCGGTPEPATDTGDDTSTPVEN